MLDYREIGGTQFLGIKKPVIKAHGSSNAKAFKNAIRQAINYVESGVTEEISVAAQDYAARRKAEQAQRKQEIENNEKTEA